MNLYKRRIWANRIGITLSMFAMSLGLIALMWILWTLFSKGFAALSWDLFTQDTPAPGSEGGGLRNAIVGSGLILLFSMLIATPVGILAGIYLAEYRSCLQICFLYPLHDRHHAVGTVDRDWLVCVCTVCCNDWRILRLGGVTGAGADRHPGGGAYN